MIQRHLDECARCRRYYQKMSMLLEKSDPALLPRLEPDPFLPAKIRARAAEGRAARVPVKAAGWIPLSAAAAMFFVAAATGVYLGRGLSTAARPAAESELVDSYSEAFSQESLADRWEVAVQNGGEEE